MRIPRIVLLVLVIGVTFAGCDTDPVGPSENVPSPVIGSGTGT